jgi:uncharacterized protein (DUF2132 family)
MLEAPLTELVARHGWPGLAAHVDLRCFDLDPGLSSSVERLPRTERARQKVDALLLEDLRDAQR